MEYTQTLSPELRQTLLGVLKLMTELKTAPFDILSAEMYAAIFHNLKTLSANINDAAEVRLVFNTTPGSEIDSFLQEGGKMSNVIR